MKRERGGGKKHGFVLKGNPMSANTSAKDVAMLTGFFEKWKMQLRKMERGQKTKKARQNELMRIVEAIYRECKVCKSQQKYVRRWQQLLCVSE